ncbi:epidermal growth factor receptor kinase substrate 8-like protein 3 [Danio rerio]|uniref:EPS8-like 3a n=1 Tax=Danio rerio TaxID=7955 RepID=E7F362_DANRE|nr:epidermal growth factor receptor kinase substrate 8-like protein 3 [Danio rerio]|eukprot:XP_002666161.1 epidermal growth factor receptor kinase substrate 8-like protein 3 [Danio rerio]
MLRDSSPFGWSGGYAESLRSSVTAADESSSDVLDLSRPSAKSIYHQRKEYAESVNRQMHQFQHRVEHLFTCELDGQQLCDVDDCLERLKYLDATGRVWGQDVILEVQDAALRLADIETREVLESWPLSCVLELKAVLDESVYDSLLTVSVQERGSRTVSVFMFQSETLRADYLKKDLQRLLQNSRDDPRQSNSSKAAVGNITQKNSRRASPPPELILQRPAERWAAPDYDDSPVATPPTSRNNSTHTKVVAPPPQTKTPPHKQTTPPRTEEPPVREAPPPQKPYTERERNVDILNHLINDIEAFVGRLTAVAPKMDKKKKKQKKQKAVKGMPSDEEFTVCLRKIKMAFNLLGKLQGKIDNPSAAELTHCLFSILELVVYHCNEDLPPSIVAPLFEPECVVFLSEEATPEEDHLWQSLGDAWNIPSTKWPEDDDDIPTFTPVFDDGWEPPAIRNPEPTYKQISKQEPAYKSISKEDTPRTSVARQMSRTAEPELEPEQSELPASFMRAIFDFSARNDRELSITKGEELQLLDMSKKWWKVKNQRGQIGFVPNNMLQQQNQEEEKEEAPSAPALNRKSRPEEVRAWLEHKGFSKITVRCLGGVSGSMLLGMTRDELKTICPEEGGRVFYQLQNIKSALAMASEVRPMI